MQNEGSLLVQFNEQVLSVSVGALEFGAFQGTLEVLAGGGQHLLVADRGFLDFLMQRSGVKLGFK
jgi:hypothetical protein